jgi:hypothetical protein
MRKITMLAVLLALTLATLAAVPALADDVTFDEIPAFNSNSPVTDQFAAEGITLNGTNAGTWSGLPGDPGNWGVTGTNGRNFLGFNGNPYGDTIHFNSAVNGASFDASRTDGSVDGTLTVNAFSGLNLLGTVTVNLGAINTWSNISFSFAGITELQIIGTGSGFHPFGIDNLQFNLTETPEPGSIMLLGSGLLTMAGALRKRIVGSQH